MNIHVLYQNPQGELFKVWMIFRFVDSDLWQMNLYHKHKRDTEISVLNEYEFNMNCSYMFSLKVATFIYKLPTDMTLFKHEQLLNDFCLQNNIFFCSLFCQSKQMDSWTSFSSVHSLKIYNCEQTIEKVLNKNCFLMKERNLIVYLTTHTCSSFCIEAVPMSYLSLLLF